MEALDGRQLLSKPILAKQETNNGPPVLTKGFLLPSPC